jgi:hypothetical protein
MENHHLFSNYLLETNQVPQKERTALKYSVLNGILLEKSLHKRFHHEFGNKTTPLMMMAFIERLEKSDPFLDKEKTRRAKSWVLSLYRELTLIYPIVRSLKL